MAERSAKMESGIRPSFSIFDHLLTVLRTFDETNSNRYCRIIINIRLFYINCRISEKLQFYIEKMLSCKIKSFDNQFLHLMLKSNIFIY